MKKLKGSVAAKIVAVMLLIMMIGLMCACVVGAAVLENFGAYSGGYSATADAVVKNYCEERSYSAQRMLWDGADPATVFPGSAFCFTVKDETGKVVYDNLDGRETMCQCETVPFYIHSGDDVFIEVSITGLETAHGTTPKTDAEAPEAREPMYTLTGYLLSQVPAGDDLDLILRATGIGYNMRYGVIVGAAVALGLAVLLFIFLLSAAGHRDGTDEIRPGFLDKLPFDLFTAIVILVEVCILGLCSAMGYDLDGWVLLLTLLSLAAVVFLLIGIVWCMSWAVRVKLHTALKGCLCYRLLAWLWRGAKKLWSIARELIQGLPLIPKASVIIGGILLVEFIFTCAADSAGGRLFGWFLERSVLVALTLYTLLCMKKLLKAGKEISSGNMSYTVDTSRMYGPLKEHGEDLNSITAGMNRAVAERMKSERFKTELITNVSHDIKTPLTSIINYVDLMEKEEPENERMKEYLEVLSRQSARLKKLIDDLMDASKASTGSLTVNLQSCELGVLIDQCTGEYGEKLQSAGLELVVNKPEKTVVIMADGRHMWRIFDNLLSNVCKYAQRGTRVYLSLEQQGERAVVILRNISASMLNVSGEELMERFVRGDSSRSTEGSGLGLNIARSLVQLQKGSMELAVDGDLFKVTLTFDAVQE